MGRREKFVFKNRFLCCFILYFFSLSLGVCQAFAQDDEFVLEEVVVTGSRIVRNNNESASPIVTVDETLFNQSATVAIETQLNKLPQFTPTVDVPTTGGDIQPTARNTPGEATVALRGLGTNRTLVLINGRRGTPANAMGVLDINTIPAAAIKYVEAISGGASSTYGADAMAGVLNFIMNDDFEGFQIDTQTGITQEGDNFEYQVSGIVGGDISDGRGHVNMAFSHNRRDSAKQIDRDWYRDLWADPSIGGTTFTSEFSGIVAGNSNLPDSAVVNQVVDGATFKSTKGATFFVDGNGNAFSGFETASIPGISGADIIDGVNYKLQNNGIIGINYADNYLIFPLERSNGYTSGEYELNEWISFFGQGYFNQTRTQTMQAATAARSGWGVKIDPTINRDAIPAELLAIIDSRPNPTALVDTYIKLPFDRGSQTDVFTYNIVAGLKGDIPKIGWTWDAFVSQGQAETTVLQTGFASLQRFRAIMTSGPSFGQGFVSSDPAFGDYSNQESGGFGASVATCTSGLKPFDWSGVTQDCLDAIKADLKTKQLMKQTIWEANLQGPIVELPAGELRGAIGVSTRENDYTFQNDTLSTKGTSFIEQVLGLYPAGDSGGIIDTTEEYAELLIPVLKDIPFIKSLNLELGGRRSDYNTTGVSYTYKALMDWRTTDWIRLRGGYNRAERAPNVAELFLAPEQTLAFAAGGDVCSTANRQPWGANKDRNPANWQDVVELCGVLMEVTGDPDADINYYGISWQEVAAGATPTNTQASGGGYQFPTTIGNPNLDPETADTWTAGIVLDSPFADMPYLADLRLSIDYYRIEIEDAIGEQSADIVMQQCADPRFNPTFDPDSPYCAGFNRNQTGQIGELRRTFFNNGRFQTSGIDFSINWGMDLGPGRIGVNSLLNYLIDTKSSELDVLPLVDYAGTFGPTQNGLNGNSYEFRSLTTFSYTINDLHLAVRWQHLDDIESAASATVITTTEGSREYDVFDLQGSYRLLENVQLRFGMENIFNEEPPLTGRDPARTDGMYGGSFNAQNYDTVGRRFYLGARVSF